MLCVFNILDLYSIIFKLLISLSIKTQFSKSRDFIVIKKSKKFRVNFIVFLKHLNVLSTDQLFDRRFASIDKRANLYIYIVKKIIL